jgi:hypothetical protein
MKITVLEKGKYKYPKNKSPGDIVVFDNGEIFAWEGGIWHLLGGRFIDKKWRDVILNYLEDGWSDKDTIAWDLKEIFSLVKTFDLETVKIFSSEEEEKEEEEENKWIKKLLDNVVLFAGKLDRKT